MKPRTVAVVALIVVPAAARANDRHVAAQQSIQAAINAADPGDVIHVIGAHAEQVVVWKDVTLTGDPGATISPPASLRTFRFMSGFEDDGVTRDFQDGAGLVTVTTPNATISNLDIDGRRLLATLPALNGILFVNGGGAVRGCHVHGIDDARGLLEVGPPEIMGGIAIMAVSDLDADLPPDATMPPEDMRFVTVTDTRIENFDGFGIGASGISDDPHAGIVRIRLTAEDNVVVGAGETRVHGQWGLIAFRGAVGVFRRNYVSDIIYTGQRWATEVPAALHGNFGDGYVVEDNTFERVHQAIHVFDMTGPVSIRGNHILATGTDWNPPQGIIASDDVSVDVSDNDITTDSVSSPLMHNQSFGIFVRTFEGSTIVGNTVHVRVIGPPAGDILGAPDGIATRLDGHLISGNVVSGPGHGASAGVLVVGSHNTITGNRLANVDAGIVLYDAPFFGYPTEDNTVADSVYTDVATPVLSGPGSGKFIPGSPPGGCGPFNHIFGCHP
jgi:hypothetical protein